MYSIEYNKRGKWFIMHISRRRCVDKENTHDSETYGSYSNISTIPRLSKFVEAQTAETVHIC